MAKRTRATPTCIGRAFVTPTMVAMTHAVSREAQGPIAQKATSYTAAAGSLTANPLMTSPMTQAVTENKAAERNSTPTMARPTTLRSLLVTSSDRVEMASKPRKDMTQMEVAVKMLWM